MARARRAWIQNPCQGDCVDCGICVQVCPTGIDIRNGLQYECIGCAACIDACDQVMDKMNYPRGLIRYSTENAIKKGGARRKSLPTCFVRGPDLRRDPCPSFDRLRMGIGHALPLRVDIIRDRSMLAREVEGGLIENIYRLQVMNMSESARKFECPRQGWRISGSAATRRFQSNPPRSSRSTSRFRFLRMQRNRARTRFSRRQREGRSECSRTRENNFPDAGIGRSKCTA